MQNKKYLVKLVYKVGNKFNFDTDGCSDYLHIDQKNGYWFLADPCTHKIQDDELYKFEFTMQELEELNLIDNPIFKIEEM